MGEPRAGVAHFILNQHPVIAQWQQGKAFGVSSSPEKVFGEGAFPEVETSTGRTPSIMLQE